MINIQKITGRLGNQMFQFAALYAMSREFDIDFYFQDPKWFEKYADEIKKLYGEGIGYTDKVSIHVRRGGNPVNKDEPNYSDNPFYVTLDEDYYRRAMALFPNEKFLVFSDDIAWCMAQDMFSDCEFHQGTEILDMNAMASCKSNIIANSSFSWWAAYLNPNVDKKVIAPKDWYTDGVERTKCPPEWRRI